MRSSPFGPCGGGSGTLSQIVRRYWSCLTGFRPGGVRVLQVLQHPHPAAVVEADAHRLADHRLAGDARRREALGQLHPLDGFLGREPLSRRERARERRAMASASARRCIVRAPVATCGVMPRIAGCSGGARNASTERQSLRDAVGHG